MTVKIFKLSMAVLLFVALSVAAEPVVFGNEKAVIRIVNSETALWQYRIAETGKTFPVEGPVFEIDGKPVRFLLTSVRQAGEPVTLRNGVLEYTVIGESMDFPDLQLRMVFRIPKFILTIPFNYCIIIALSTYEWGFP